MRVWALIPLVLLVGLIGVAGFVLLRGSPHETVSDGQIGRAAPTFALSRLGGGELVTSDELAGRAHIVNLFASWCVPCRAEHPLLMALQQRGVPVLGVAYKDDAADTEAFLHELGNPFSVVALDPDGRFALELGTAGVPETFVIGADGRILALHRGPLTDEVIAEKILPALGASTD